MSRHTKRDRQRARQRCSKVEKEIKYVIKKFDGDANSGANIRFKGNPKVVNANHSSAGNVSKS